MLPVLASDRREGHAFAMRDEAGRGGVAPLPKAGTAPREAPEGGSGAPLRRDEERGAGPDEASGDLLRPGLGDGCAAALVGAGAS